MIHIINTREVGLMERGIEVGLTPSLYMYGIYYERCYFEYITITSVTKSLTNIKTDLITELHDGEKSNYKPFHFKIWES